MRYALFFSIAVLTLVTGCGGNSSGNQPITQSQASSFVTGSSLTSFVRLAQAQDSQNVSKVAISAGTRGNCDPTFSGDTVDGDGDLIRKNATLTYGCNYTFGGLQIAASGVLTQTDGDDTKVYPRGGASFSFNNLAASLGAISSEGNTTVTTTFNGPITVTEAANVYTVVSDLSASLSVVSPSGNFSGSSSYKMNATLTPDDPANPKTAGVITSLNGSYSLTLQQANYTLSAVGANLRWSDTCPDGRLQSGTLTFSDTGKNTIVVTYAGCTAAGSFNGTPLVTSR